MRVCGDLRSVVLEMSGDLMFCVRVRAFDVQVQYCAVAIVLVQFWGPESVELSNKNFDVPTKWRPDVRRAATAKDKRGHSPPTNIKLLPPTKDEGGRHTIG